MSASVICRACGTRLKLPPEFTGKKAKCPKCSARVDVAAALNATAYLPTLANEPIPTTERQSTPNPKSTPEREEDPLPYPFLNPVTPSPVPPSQPTNPNDLKKNAQTPSLTRKQFEPLPLDDPPLSFDNDPSAAQPPTSPAGPPPFRVPVQVAADSANLFHGPCDAVFVSHGVFLESIPYRPFLYVPIRSSVSFVSRCGLEVTSPDRRKVTFVFSGRNAQQLAEDTTAFLAGERGVPDRGEYRRSPQWMLGLALMPAMGLTIGPIVLSQTTNLGLEPGLKLGVAFAGAGLLANAAIVLLTKMSILGKIAAVTSVGALVTGVSLFGAIAYLAGRKDAGEQSKPEPSPLPSKPPDQNPDSPIDPPARRPTTVMDIAYSDGVYRFEEGPDEVTALAVGDEWSVLVIGYKNGITRIWRFERSTIDPSDFDLGPKSDGSPTNIQFDGTGSIIYMTCTGGTVAALWNTPPEVPVKIPGDSIAVFATPGGERFAAIRGNTLTIRYVPTAIIKNPVSTPKKTAAIPKTKGFLVTTATNEMIPSDAKGQLTAPPGRPTFLAWHPTDKLLGGMQDGSILSWGTTGPSSTIVTREHKAPVRAWAASHSTWDFATGDDKGVIGVWANKSMTPKTFYASASAAITHLSFSPSGAHLAAKDAEGTISVWDLSAQRAILKVRRPAAKAIAYGPTDDLLLLSDGKAVELWYIPELDRRP